MSYTPLPAPAGSKPIAEVFDPDATGPMHGRYVPVGSPRGKEILAAKDKK